MAIMALRPRRSGGLSCEWLGAVPASPGARHVVLLSGGQDSATCLRLAALTAGHAEHVTAVSFSYGQRHHEELQAASLIAREMQVRHVVLGVEALGQLGGSALLGEEVIAPEVLGKPNPAQTDSLPNTWVPHRNSVFLSLAAAVASRVAARYLWIGCSQVDFSGYPDCREGFLERKQSEINASESSPDSLDRQIVAPLLFLSKADTFDLANQTAILPLIIAHTRTCYNGDTRKNAWGLGCGLCAACVLRRNGWLEYVSRSK